MIYNIQIGTCAFRAAVSKIEYQKSTTDGAAMTKEADDVTCSVP